MNILESITSAKRLSAEQLSKKSGISLERVETLLSGADPSLREIRELAEALHVSIADLVSRPQTEKVEFLFRDAVAKGKADPITVSSLSQKMTCSVFLMDSQQTSPPWWSKLFSRESLTYDAAEENATIFRKAFCGDDQLGPLPYLPKIIAEQMNILLFVINNSQMDGASAFFEGRPFVFIAARFAPRMLFTLAHEVAHIVAHHDPSQASLVVDEARGNESLRGKGKQEQYAHAFASALLMPARGLGIALKKIRDLNDIRSDSPVGDIEILLLSRIFAVSFEATAMRCEALGILPEGGAYSLNKFLRDNYGSAEKRAQELGLPERSKIEFPSVPEPLLRSAVEKIKEGSLSLGKASSLLGLTASDLVEANSSAIH